MSETMKAMRKADMIAKLVAYRMRQYPALYTPGTESDCEYFWKKFAPTKRDLVFWMTEYRLAA
jgi:hypothetical protein